MRTSHFSTRLKTSFKAARPLVLVIAVSLALVISSCATPKHTRPHPRFGAGVGTAAPVATAFNAPKAPWEIWARRSSSASISSADELARSGQLHEAAKAYQDIIDNKDMLELHEDALMRRSGTLLKFGASQRVLDETTVYLQESGKEISDVSPKIAIVIAYAYLHQGNRDQALAWFGHAHSKAASGDDLSFRAKKDIVKVVRSFAEDEFLAARGRWRPHQSIGPVFTSEERRRISGLGAEALDIAKWYRAETYIGTADSGMKIASQEKTESAEVLNFEPGSDTLTLGVLLPISGRFELHGKRVLQGIELAVKQLEADGREINLVVADSTGEADVAASEYERLASQEGASIVLGPLLVKTSEAVATKALTSSVPFLSFTKRDGIPDLGPAVFRLGATTQDQIKELLEYSVINLGLKRFAILYPSTETGIDFSRKFTTHINSQGAELVVQTSYQSDDEISIQAAVLMLGEESLDGIFVADSLEKAFPMIQAVRGAESPQREVPLLGPAAWDDVIAIRGYGKLLDGAIYVTPFFAQSVGPQIVSFISSFKEEYSSEPGLLSAQGYDAAKFIVQRMPNRPSGPQTLIEALHSAETYYGVTGKLSVSDNGDIRRRMSVVRLMDGDLVEVVSKGNATEVNWDGREYEELSEELEIADDSGEPEQVSYATSY